MKKERPELNIEELLKLIEAYNQNNVNNFLDLSIQGKKFFGKDTIENIKDFAMPFFFNIEEINKPIPITQYQEFISTIAKAQPDLFQKEREYMQNIILNIFDHPMKFVEYLFPVYSNNFNIRCAQKNKELLDICLNLDDSRDLSIPNKKMIDLLVFFKQIRDFLNKRNMTGAYSEFIIFISKHKLYSKKQKAKIIEKIDEITQIIEEHEIKIKEILKDPTEFGRNVLRAAHYTQSHIEYFCSYIHRLVHIKINGNRNYGNMYYRYNSTNFNINDFTGMCEKELTDFEALQSFLIQYSNILKELRNINAHQVAGYIKLSEDHEKLIIPVIGKKDALELNHAKLCEVIISYGIFINKIELHPKSPYDISEDTFGIMK